MCAASSILAGPLVRWLPAFLLGGSIVSVLSATPAGTEPPLEMSKLVVLGQRELAPPEPWRYAQVPGLEILTAASDRETRKLLRGFQRFNGAIRVVWPALQGHPPVPMTLILCGPGKTFATFLPADPHPTATGRASLLLRNPEQAAILLNFGAKTIDLAPAEADGPIDVSSPGEGTVADASAGASVRVDYDRQLYREYVRHLPGFQQPRLPAWLEEGLAQLLMGMKVDPKFIEFARVEDPNLQSAGARLTDTDTDSGNGNEDGAVAPPTVKPQEEHDFNRALARKGLIPLAEFFAVTHDSPAANNPLAGKWAKQAQALVHLWLYGEGKRFNAGFAHFVVRSGQEPVTEAMFKECFQMGHDDMLAALRLHIDHPAYQSQEFSAGPGGGLPEPAPVALRDATAAEVGRIKGEAQLLAGHPEQAYAEMLAAHRRGAPDAALLASLGLLEKSRGEPAQARKLLEAAAEKQVMRPRAYLELARLRLAEVQPAVSNAPALLTAVQAQAVLQPLRIAVQQPPRLPEVYELMADVWLRSEVAPGRQDLALLNRGVMAFPRRPVLLLRAAELNGRFGDPAAARVMVDFGLKLSRTPEARRAFEEAQAALPPAPAK